ncbi:MAG: SCO family protein [Aquificota bacterium]|nr:SCO family protein [Aquificota bacterium]
MAPLLVPLLLSFLFYSFPKDIVPDAEKVLSKKVPDVNLLTDGGRKVKLSEIADGKPVLLSFVYTGCTSSCPLIVKGIKEAVNDLNRTDLRVLLVDFDGRDTLEDLRRFREVKRIPEGWTVAKAEGEDLAVLTSSLDFKFFYDERTDMFAHPNVLVVLTPDLRVSSYFLGVSYDTEKLAEAVTRASRGEVSLDPIRSLILKCFRYDPITGTYTVDWSFIAMLVGGLIPLLSMAYFLFLRNLTVNIRKVLNRPAGGGELS